MMRGTPRTFVGPTVFTLEDAVCVHVVDAVRSQLGAIPGVRACELDVSAGVLVVTAESPVDRSTVLDVLHAAGCAVRA
ncbi:copper chaperone CopZ [Marmoricola bigeumensis]|uniref:Copper chaperone CopZ n=1 Tax=Nocardioides marmoribigeumensis TaxID=433649 RepID=A0ABU2BU14_9ACTN|nr:copper chaperone CopZ [Nocardioides marmoribigeumensis]